MTISTFKVQVVDLAPNLSTRPVGAMARDRLVQLLNDYSVIEVDFEHHSLTPSFADECIGRLAAVIGFEQFKQRIKLVNINASNRPLVKHVIVTRCQEGVLMH
ncbi:STAS-like domain-containing protein [Undibacterium sp. FT147W]|uniref:STAS-like domain-containing protein n=1 Tax=Undibacterium rivi TaxID=2828729 RepID=A0ABS5H0U6_9BURK|nr:STAS-like domain-containing protein [Undibacterium rivi]MBR7792329.1 STAS-like domain-containing protein [Undibacterium rivi]